MTRLDFGKFGRAHGLRGELRFWPHNPDSELIMVGRQIDVGPSMSALKRYEITKVRHDSKGPLVSLKGVTSRVAAGVLVGHSWFEQRDAFTAPADDEFYIIDLVGKPVRTESGTLIGTLVDVVDNGGPYEMLVVKAGAERYLIPNVESFIPTIGPDVSEIIVRPIEGLLEGLSEAAATGDEG